MADGYKALREAYLSESNEFTELNKQYNRAVLKDELNDELELKFFKAERNLRESYRAMQNAKIEEGGE